MKQIAIAVDWDNMMTSFHDFFEVFFASFQKTGNKVGIVSVRPETEREMLMGKMKDVGIVPDFLILKQTGMENIPDGVFKGKVCKDLGIDYIFDDFEYSDPQMISDFLTVNEGRTEPFTGFAYDPDGQEKDNH